MATLLPNDALDTCGCCKADTGVAAHDNPPGLDAFRYRLGTHSAFLARMKARLHNAHPPDLDEETPLRALTTRAPDDPSIALLDAFAAVADVLTFYQERYANEGFLRTATERRSVLELARTIGYELRPGVAAGVYLAFALDDKKGAPGEATISAGTQLQSLPVKDGELPQTFETGEDFTAYAEWNELRPRLSRSQTVTLDGSTLTLDGTALYLDGIGLNIQVGDLLLFVQTDDAGVVDEVAARHAKAVTPEPKVQRTTVTLEGAVAIRSVDAAPVSTFGSAVGGASQTLFNNLNVNAVLLGSVLSESAMQALLHINRWTTDEVLSYVDKLTTNNAPGLTVYVFREKAGFFGHNAPLYGSLPGSNPDVPRSNTNKPNGYPNDWDSASSPWPVTKDSVTNANYTDATVYLERPVKGILQDSWAVFEQTGNSAFIGQITSAADASLAGFGMSGKATALDLEDASGAIRKAAGDDLDDFYVRKATAYVKSEALTLAPIPITDNLVKGATELELDTMVLGLQVGQAVALTGEQADAEGVLRSEIKLLADVVHYDGRTTLVFTGGLDYGYLRATVRINANVVHATHGETVAGEKLGGGDGSQKHQQFTLKKPPLTYVSAATPSGTESTLTVRIDGIAWRQVDSLYGLGPDDRAYIVRLDDAANAHVRFGDGVQGARLPTGQENVAATYRSGIGSGGEVQAEQIALIKKKPYGVSSVTNPTAAAGADDPETLADARTNAPLTVLTLDRIVSLYDYEAFARAFAGIGKARAVALWNGTATFVHLTIADADGDPVDDTSDLFTNLLDAIESTRDPLQAVDLGSFSPRFFDVAARVWIDAAYLWDDVAADIEARLNDAFSFEARAFAQPVTAAEVITVIHQAKGVVAVDLDALYAVDDLGQAVPPLLASVLPAAAARYDVGTGTIAPAELLLLNTFGITLTEATP